MTNIWNSAGGSTPTSLNRWDSSWPRFVDDPRRSELLKYFEDRFGIGLRVFASFRLLEGRQTCWLLQRSPYIDKVRSLRVHTAGIPVLRKIKDQIKPTTAALQIFGSKATRNVINLQGHQLTHLLQNHAIVVHLPVAPGYVILTCQKHILGCGLYTSKRLLSQIPRSYMATSIET